MCKILHLLSGSGGIQTQIQLQSLPFHFNSIMEVENDLGEARKSRKNMVNGWSKKQRSLFRYSQVSRKGILP